MRYLSGIQPTGRLHLGNYFGMIRPAVELQAKGEAYYFLADYHALTGASEAGQLEVLVKETFLDLLACGVDPERAVVFRQSAVPEVHELAWYLSTVTPWDYWRGVTVIRIRSRRGSLPPTASLLIPS